MSYLLVIIWKNKVATKLRTGKLGTVNVLHIILYSILPHSLFERFIDIPLSIPFGDVFPFVVKLFTTGQC